MNSSADHLPSESPLALRLLGKTEASDSVVAPYHLARMVARVLVSRHLRQRAKWCALAKTLARHAMVEARLVHQAMNWLDRRKQDV
ncbi:MAG: hypothetical protein HS117_06085 [Verrucomicrobiaceae bacterium]|nr:hypothetical protein [Verrucomicrobiaceae bacterium]